MTLTLHDCPCCTCAPPPKTCWDCAWDAPDTVGGALKGAPCHWESLEEATDRWVFDYCDEDEGRPLDAHAPPCPGWQPKEPT